MIELRQYACSIRKETGLTEEEFNQLFVQYMEDNNWFDIPCSVTEDTVYIDETKGDLYLGNIYTFFKNRLLSEQDKTNLLLSMMDDAFPETAELISGFINQYDIPDEISYLIVNFLLHSLPCEIDEMDNNDAERLIKDASEDMEKYYGEIICEFLRWVMENTKTNYHRTFYMTERLPQNETTQAYGMDEYMRLMYLLFNEDIIRSNNMIQKATESPRYAATWLYLSLHFICALRDSDMKRIYHPTLDDYPHNVLRKIKEGTFSDAEAKAVLYSITWRHSVLPLTPNKTKRHSNISSVKLCFPESTEVLFGTLFAINEAYFQFYRQNPTEPLIKPIKTFDQISRYMGDEIGSLFRKADFSSRRANKSYLQSIFLLTDDVLSNEENQFNTKGYILAALARSHKGSYGEFAETTAVYLKDAKFSGLTPEYVAKELFERGVLSFIPSMLLKMIDYDGFSKLPIHKQTELIKMIGLTPNEINDIVSFSDISRKRSAKVVKQLFENKDDSRNIILNTLHRIANGKAQSKQEECMCLITGMGKKCPYAMRLSCVGCDFEISTKSTVFLIMSEYKRLKRMYRQSETSLEKGKYKYLVERVVIPTLDETVSCMYEMYGEDAGATLEAIIKEVENE